ncbi:MAG: hypothetical protein HOV87_30060, partial [Catenulispora sp.]|nr:hypothetical protein [Catenulispora sp.]
ARAGTWQGSFPALIESATGAADRAEPDRIPCGAIGTGRAPRWPRGVDASAVLLAMAPPEVVELFVEDCRRNPASRGILVRMLDRGPLLPPLVDAATADEVAIPAMLGADTRNPAFAVAGLRYRVWLHHGNVEGLQEVYLDRSADLAIRIGCLRRAEAAGGFSSAFIEQLLNKASHPPLVEPLLASSDPRLVLRLLKRLSRHALSTPALRWAGYATLARTAGLEPVWALEQERAGDLAKMAEPVRVSMATGDAAPILAAADAAPLVLGAFGTPRELGAPDLEPWPYTDLIREHVETSWRRRRAVSLLRVRAQEGAAPI